MLPRKLTHSHLLPSLPLACIILPPYAEDGFLSAFPRSVLDRQQNMQGVWAPYYTLHKVGSGLADAYEHLG